MWRDGQGANQQTGSRGRRSQPARGCTSEMKRARFASAIGRGPLGPGTRSQQTAPWHSNCTPHPAKIYPGEAYAVPRSLQARTPSLPHTNSMRPRQVWVYTNPDRLIGDVGNHFLCTGCAFSLLQVRDGNESNTGVCPA